MVVVVVEVRGRGLGRGGRGVGKDEMVEPGAAREAKGAMGESAVTLCAVNAVMWDVSAVGWERKPSMSEMSPSWSGGEAAGRRSAVNSETRHESGALWPRATIPGRLGTGARGGLRSGAIPSSSLSATKSSMSIVDGVMCKSVWVSRYRGEVDSASPRHGTALHDLIDALFGVCRSTMSCA